jgi:hypothetical protein
MSRLNNQRTNARPEEQVADFDVRLIEMTASPESGKRESGAAWHIWKKGRRSTAVFWSLNRGRLVVQTAMRRSVIGERQLLRSMSAVSRTAA